MSSVQVITIDGNALTCDGAAIAQLEAHETLGPYDDDGDILYVPFHAVDFAIVESREVSPVAPPDTNCVESNGCAGLTLFGAFRGEVAQEPFVINDGDVINAYGEYGLTPAVFMGDDPQGEPINSIITSDSDAFEVVPDIFPYIRFVEPGAGTTGTITVEPVGYGCKFEFTLTWSAS